ncbi:MAG TPA: hypothetical protein DCZ75_06225 [Geobacter sp.]|nr:hypothetical protein [Geobacter sp.]
MNSYQRVMNTLSGRPVDRVPAFAILGAYGANLTGCDLRTLYSDAGAYLQAQQALQSSFGFDLVLAPFDFSAIAEAFGGETVWSGLQTPNMRRPAAPTVARALDLRLPGPGDGRLSFILEATRALAQLYQERVPVIAVLPGPGILPSLLVGLDLWMETVLFEPGAARNLLSYSGDFLVALGNALVEAGADCLVFTEGMACAEIAPRALFVDAVLPHLREILARIDGPKIISSTGGSINQTLDLLPGIPGVVGAVAGSRDDLVESRRLVGPHFNLLGNLDNLAFASVGAEEMQQMSLDCLQAAAHGGHFILANSGGDIPQATPAENLLAMHGAAVRYPATGRLQ